MTVRIGWGTSIVIVFVLLAVIEVIAGLLPSHVHAGPGDYAYLKPIPNTTYCGVFVTNNNATWLVVENTGELFVTNTNNSIAPLLYVPGGKWYVVLPVANNTYGEPYRWYYCNASAVFPDPFMNVTSYIGSLGTEVPLDWGIATWGSDYSIVVNSSGTFITTGNAYVILGDYVSNATYWGVHVNANPQGCLTIFDNNEIITPPTTVVGVIFVVAKPHCNASITP